MAYFPDGDVIVVTGAARGIGEATARRLFEEGARVVLVDIDFERAQWVAQSLAESLTGETGRKDAPAPSAGARAIALKADVSNRNDIEAVVRRTLDTWGSIQGLVNCAGIAGRSAPIWEQTDADWERMLQINLDSVFYFCRAVIPYMRERGYGRIVNVASIAGKEGNPNAVPYSAAKAAVIGLTKAVAKEVAKDGILVNSVAPAVIETDILGQLSREHVDYMLQRIPMGRPGQPSEVAALIAWLCSRECSFSTGFCYDISGGRATY